MDEAQAEVVWEDDIQLVLLPEGFEMETGDYRTERVAAGLLLTKLPSDDLNRSIVFDLTGP